VVLLVIRLLALMISGTVVNSVEITQSTWGPVSPYSPQIRRPVGNLRINASPKGLNL